MEFNEKLQKLRTSENLTQEELAQKLFVSRTAVSKWESGRGYPSIDSLKTIANYFHITIDELIGGEEMVTLAEEDMKNTNKKYTALICGILDCLIALLFFIPMFASSGSNPVTMLNLTGVSGWLKIVFISVTALTVINGFSTVVISNFDKALWNKHRIITGMALSVMGTILFILTRQPYAGVFYLFLFLTKGVLVIKSK